MILNNIDCEVPEGMKAWYKMEREAKDKYNELKPKILNIDSSDIYYANIDKNTKTSEIFEDFSWSGKTLLCLKDMFFINYLYLKKDLYWNVYEKRECWIDLLIHRDQIYFDIREDNQGITMTDLKEYAQTALIELEGHIEELGDLYGELSDVKEDFVNAMENNENYGSYRRVFFEPIFLRAQARNRCYGGTKRFLIVGARIKGCDAPKR